MTLTVTQFKKQLKENNIKRVYLFYGEEKFLHEVYLKQLKSAVIDNTFADFNYNIFSESNANFDNFVEAVEGYPQMAEKKMIVVKNTDFLKLTEYQKSMANLIANSPSYAVIVFVENELTKIKKDLLKIIEENGAIVNFAKQNPQDLRAWVNKKFATAGKKMTINDMEHLVEICDRSLSNLTMECDKLIAYIGDDEVITRDIIDKMVQVPLEYKIFAMADKLLSNDSQGAYLLLKELKNNKEQPTVMLSIIYSQISTLFMFKKMRANNQNAEAFLPSNRKFLAKRFYNECTKHSEEKLRSSMKLCAQFDEQIKTGQIEGFTALEIVMANILQSA